MPDTKWCAHCSTIKNISDFTLHRNRYDGRQVYCAACRSAIQREKRNMQVVEKQCWKCKENKPGSEFSKNMARKDGLADQCRSCTKEYQNRRYQQLHGNKQQVKEIVMNQATTPDEQPTSNEAMDVLGFETLSDIERMMHKAEVLLTDLISKCTSQDELIQERDVRIAFLQKALIDAESTLNNYRVDAEQWREFKKTNDARKVQITRELLGNAMAQAQRLVGR